MEKVLYLLLDKGTRRLVGFYTYGKLQKFDYSFRTRKPPMLKIEHKPHNKIERKRFP